MFYRYAISAVIAAVLTGMSATAGATTITFFYDNKAAFDAAASTALYEDFESFSPKDTNLPLISLGIIAYTPFATASLPNLLVSSPGYLNYGVNVSPTTSSILTTSGDEDFEMAFGIAQTAVGFVGYLNGLGPGTVKVFDGGTLLDTYNLPDVSGGAKIHFGVVSAGGTFDKLRWTSTAGSLLNTGVDDISLSAVPEPSTYALLATGLLVIGVLKQRRRLPRT